MRDHQAILKTPAQSSFTRRQLNTFAIICGMGMGTAPVAGWAAAPPPAVPPAQEFQGCVQQSPSDKTVLILSTESACATLSGKFTAAQLDGHQVDLKGVLTPRTPDLPASIRVDTVVSVGKACTDVCSLRPPKSRGLGKGGEIPGKEGGTPGAAPTQPPAPQ